MSLSDSDQPVTKSDVADESKNASSSSSSSSFNDGSELIVEFSQRQHRIIRQRRQTSSTSSAEYPHTNTDTNTKRKGTNTLTLNIDSNSNGEGHAEKTASSPAFSTTTGPYPYSYKQVRFSDEIHSRSIPYPSKEELLQRWDSKKDKVIFKQELARDVYSIRHLLSSTPMEALEKEVLYWCLGLEALVSAQVTRLVRGMKVEHSRSIVQMQHHLSDDQLAAYASGRSLQSRERAQELAAGNWEILP